MSEDTTKMLREEILKRTAKIKKKNQTTKDSSPEVLNISLNSGHLRAAILLLGAIVTLLTGIGWTLFLHLDGKIDQKFLHLDTKIEHKLDYINQRVDGVISDSSFDDQVDKKLLYLDTKVERRLDYLNHRVETIVSDSKPNNK